MSIDSHDSFACDLCQFGPRYCPIHMHTQQVRPTSVRALSAVATTDEEAEDVYREYVSRHGYALGGGWDGLHPSVRRAMPLLMNIAVERDRGRLMSTLSEVGKRPVDIAQAEQKSDVMTPTAARSFPFSEQEPPSHYPAFIGDAPLERLPDCGACCLTWVYGYKLTIFNQGEELKRYRCAPCALRWT